MKEVPILFSTPMVQAILDGRKTQTRRIVNHPLDDRGVRTTSVLFEDWHGKEVKPKAKPGDLLWVRETWREYFQNIDGYIQYDNKIIEFATDNPEPIYELDGDGFHVFNKDGSEKMIPWKPSIHMKKEIARIWLRMTDVRVERLNEISESDAIAEGAGKPENLNP